MTAAGSTQGKCRHQVAVRRRTDRQGKTLSAIIQEALREARARRLQGEFGELKRFWSERAQRLGILTEEDLERHLRS